MDRGRERRGYENRDSGYGGETYRPAERQRTPPRSYRGRSPGPPRRGRSPPPYSGSYSSRGGRYGDRPRSRSPPRRRSRSPRVGGHDDDHGFRGRARSPPRNAGRQRSPTYRQQSRSPYGTRPREKSPFQGRRDRDISPRGGSYRRSPPPKQGRFSDDRDDYGGRRLYGRDEPKRQAYENNYRPRERSRTPPRMSAHTSRGASPDSRNSGSGPMHTDRMDRMERLPERSRRSSPPYRSPHPEQAPAAEHGYRSRDRSPPRRTYSPQTRSPPRQESQWRERSPPPARERERDVPSRPRESSSHNTPTPSSWSQEQVSTSRFSNGEARAPPTGPRERFNADIRDVPPSGPPTGPSMGHHPRGNILSAPTRPSRDPGFRGRGRGHFSSGPPTPRSASYDRDPNAPPTGPRSSATFAPQRSPPPRYDSGGPHSSRYDSGPSHPYSAGPRGGHHGFGPPFRSNNSTSTTYPRTQRFNTGASAANAHLASLSQPVEGGRKAPSLLEPGQEKRLQQLEDEKKKLEEQIMEKEKGLRQGLREWDRAEHDAKREGLKSRLADEHLAKLSGEVPGGAAY